MYPTEGQDFEQKLSSFQDEHICHMKQTVPKLKTLYKVVTFKAHLFQKEIYIFLECILLPHHKRLLPRSGFINPQVNPKVIQVNRLSALKV